MAVKLERDEDKAVLIFDAEDKPVNIFDEDTIAALEACLNDLEQDTPSVLQVCSAKDGCFLAGADVHAIAAVKTAEEGQALAERGQRALLRLQQLSCVSVAVVRGVCLGGGLELALACDGIIAVKDERTSLGLPEIKLGIHPGFGGCVRLPKKVGWMQAVPMILSGKPVNAERAKRMGLADVLCHVEQVEQAVSLLVHRLQTKGKQGLRPRWFALPPLRALFFALAEKKLQKRFTHVDMDAAYPALRATVQVLQAIASANETQGYRLEAASIGKLAVTPSCKHLIRVFFLGEKLKHQPVVKAGKARANALSPVAVYGAGVMGSGIAWVVSRHAEVDLHDVSADVLSRGMAHMGTLANRRKTKANAARLQRIRPTLDDTGLQQVAAVVEAVPEDMAIKRALWQKLESQVPDTALLLSNTSGLSISEQQQGLKHPERMAGLHFFNPAPRMPLVEVIAGKETSQETIETVAAWAAALGKYPVVVGDAPGFLVNRCLMPLMAAALRLLAQGQGVLHVDGVLKTFGLPMGAIELADRVGLDICLHVGEHLQQSLDAEGERFALPDCLARMVKDGLLGEKSGAGFYVYDQGKPKVVNAGLSVYLPHAEHEKEFDANMTDELGVMPAQAVLDACLLPMLYEALRCLDESVAASADDVDAALIYGAGFPPFRGGLLHMFGQEDAGELKARMQAQGLEVPEAWWAYLT